MNVRKLLGKMVELGYTVDSISTKMGLNPSTVYRKIKMNGLNFTVGEMHQLVTLLNLTHEEAIAIFLPMYSQ